MDSGTKVVLIDVGNMKVTWAINNQEQDGVELSFDSLLITYMTD